MPEHSGSALPPLSFYSRADELQRRCYRRVVLQTNSRIPAPTPVMLHWHLGFEPHMLPVWPLLGWKRLPAAWVRMRLDFCFHRGGTGAGRVPETPQRLVAVSLCLWAWASYLCRLSLSRLSLQKHRSQDVIINPWHMLHITRKFSWCPWSSVCVNHHISHLLQLLINHLLIAKHSTINLYVTSQQEFQVNSKALWTRWIFQPTLWSIFHSPYPSS